MNGLAFAYIGDAYYELKIRTYLLNRGLEKVNDLHKLAVKYTSGKSQSMIITHLIEEKQLTDNEIIIYKNGRNFSGNNRKNLSPQEYHQATGYEALIGYLYLNDMNRCEEIINLSINYIERSVYAK